MESLVAYLSTLTPDQLAKVIARRPDALLQPGLTTLKELAARLAAPHQVTAVLATLTLPEIQVAEAFAAFGDGANSVERRLLASGLGVPEDDEALCRVLASLAECAVAWPAGELIHTVSLRSVWPQPLGLGSRLDALLARQRVDDLRRVATTLGVPSGSSRQSLQAALAVRLSDADEVRRLCAAAPKATRDLLTEVARRGPYLYEPGFGYSYGSASKRPATWAFEHGLVLHAGGWGGPLEMPCEVALAIRGAGHKAPFTPVPPTIPTVPVDPAAVEREAAAAANSAVRGVAAILDESSNTPVAPLKNGGVGVREIRRLGKRTGATEESVRLWLEISAAAGLAGMTEDGLLPTEAYDGWRAQQPSDQLVQVLDGWRMMRSIPLRQSEKGALKPPAFHWQPESALAPILRTTLFEAAATLPPGAAVGQFPAVVSYLRWARPAVADSIIVDSETLDLDGDSPAGMPVPGGPDELQEILTGLWREAELLGVVAHDAVTGLGRALTPVPEAAEPAGGAPPDGVGTLASVARRLLPPARDVVVLQADLTAIVAGTPSGALTALLDEVADRESRDGAWTWRFSAASVRRAFDAGASGQELLAKLRAVASGDTVPQPLEYLISDASRRHGQVRVRPAACCLHCEDPALVTEILRAKSLEKLKLARLAPTVLASAVPQEPTLAALRAAGYAPAAEAADGTRIAERRPRHRAVLRESASSGAGRVGSDDDLDDLDDLADVIPLIPMGVSVSGMSAGDGRSPAFMDPAELARRLLSQEGSTARRAGRGPRRGAARPSGRGRTR